MITNVTATTNKGRFDQKRMNRTGRDNGTHLNSEPTNPKEEICGENPAVMTCHEKRSVTHLSRPFRLSPEIQTIPHSRSLEWAFAEWRVSGKTSLICMRMAAEFSRS
ncbi:MAG: hypothetical protein RL346_956 [Verrucomicrobiota bacterium]